MWAEEIKYPNQKYINFVKILSDEFKETFQELIKIFDNL